MATAARADKAKSDAACSAAKALLDKADAAFNAGDAKGLEALLDASFFGSGPYVSAGWPDLATAKAYLEKTLAQGGRLTRDQITLHGDDDGDTVWFVADYTFIPKVPPGVLPIHRKMRHAGTVVRRGPAWKFASVGISIVAPDPSPPPPTPPTAPPAAAKPSK
jgi:hypothetical protein